MTTAVVMGIFLVRKPKCKPPSNRSSVLLLYLCIFCKNWFGTIELILDSIIDNDNWWQHVRGVCYYDCPQICWLLVSTSLNPSKKPRQDIAMPGTGGYIITPHNFDNFSLVGLPSLCLCPKYDVSKNILMPKIGCGQNSLLFFWMAFTPGVESAVFVLSGSW